MRAVVSLFTSRKNFENNRHIGPLEAPIDTHRDDLIRKDHPNIADSDIMRDTCCGLTSSSDPVFK